VKRFNEWERRHPWRAAPVMGVILFCVTMAFGVFVLDESASEALPHSLIYSIGMPLLRAPLVTWRNRHAD
jgi:hypothetical protein